MRLLALPVLVVALSAAVTAQMPDPAVMHGKALPAADLPPGTVTVRVVRERLGNDVVGQEVRIVAGAALRTATTGPEGRAEFPNVPQGQARAEAVVDGERLVSDPFVVPPSGGLRIILVAGLRAAAERAAGAAAVPATKGSVAFGPNSRVLMEFRDDALQVFYVLDVINGAATPVDIGGPLILDLPTGAAGATILQGSSPTATVAGDRVTITGPFQPGSTSVQVGFQLRHDDPAVTIEQTWPAPVEQLNVAIEKVGAVGIASPQFATVGEVRAETGTPFLLANGPPLAAGATLAIQLTGLPVHSRTPRYVALALASIIVAAGFLAAFRRRPEPTETHSRLVARRERLLADLAALQRRATASDRGDQPSRADETRRQRLVAELEKVYAELDETGATLQGGGKDAAA